ncbi:MAG: glycosyltransferase [Patescibacteria group bacterium]
MNSCIILSIIIPAYQEEENLRIILPRLYLAAQKLMVAFEIIVVDTQQSMDKTFNVCEENGVKYINREVGNNYGDAVVTGIKHAQGQYVIFMDADGSHTPEFVSELFAQHDNYDVVIASRYVTGGKTENNKILILMSLLLNIVYSVVLNLKCKDVSNSFKLYHTSQLKKLKLNCKNFDIVEEIFLKLKRNKPDLKILEIPYCFKKRLYGKTKRNLFIFIVSYLYTITKLRFSK